NIDVSGSQAILAQAGGFTGSGSTINVSGPSGTTLTGAITLSAGQGGIQAPNIQFRGPNTSLLADGDIQIFDFDGGGLLSGRIDAGGAFTGAGDFFLLDLRAGTSITIGGSIIAGDIAAGTTINIGGRLAAFGTVTAGGDITADTVAVPTIVAPSGTLTAGAGGIVPFVETPGGAAIQHTFNVFDIVSSNGIDFSGNQFAGIDGLSSGGLLTINADHLLFDFMGGIGFVNFNGADGINTPDGRGGDGGVFIANTSGDLVVNSTISASTGLNNGPAFGGAGGAVLLHSSLGSVTIDAFIEVSSDNPSLQRQSARGGSLLITSGAASGSAISIGSTAQLLSLLDVGAPGPGGSIILQANGAASTIDIDNGDGQIVASRGLVDIRQLGDFGAINLTNANIFADIVKIGALGANGTLMLGGGTISADTLLRLYAGASNGSITFTSNITLTSGTFSIVIASPVVTIMNGVVVTIGGQNPANVFTDLANYSGSGGNGLTTGMFAGAGANTLPFNQAPPFDASPGSVTVTYTGAPAGSWSNTGNWNPMIVPNNGNGGNAYDVVMGNGTLTQDIAPGVTIEQLFMNGGTIVLTNPLTLNNGLQFTGGAFSNGTLNVAGTSQQSALMTVSNTTLNNSGVYELTLTGGNVFSGGGSVFNNTGTVTKSAAGTVNFNLALNNLGTVSVQNGTLQLSAGGTIGGTLSASSGALLALANNYDLANGTQLLGPGTVQLANGT
ncbi:MAG: hypothetical protein M3176_19085, partial [Chloroflexota bacterium]|nr:hypothetical protein [Chloroflexota bacterium]